MNDQPYVAIIQYGTESALRIGNVLTQLGVNWEIVSGPDFPFPKMNPTHIILTGGPKHVYESDAYAIPDWVYPLSIPVLGICYGMQLIAFTFGGAVQPRAVSICRKIPSECQCGLEKGPIWVQEQIGDQMTIQSRWMNRYDGVTRLPDAFQVTGVTEYGEIATITDTIKWWGVQYHPEAEGYVDYELFRRFLF